MFIKTYAKNIDWLDLGDNEIPILFSARVKTTILMQQADIIFIYRKLNIRL